MKKLLSALLAFAIVLTSLCIPAVATEDKSATPPTTSTAQTLLPAYTAASSSAKKTYTDTYNDCILMTVTNTTSNEYTTYLGTLASKGYTKVVLRDMMVVCGDHANNDMAGDEEDSWKSIFTNAGYEVECVLEGLGQVPEIQQIYVEHAQAAVAEAEK